MRARWPQTLFYGALPLRAMGYDNYCEACAALAAQAKSMAPHRHECRIACFFTSDAPTAVVLVQAGLFRSAVFSLRQTLSRPSRRAPVADGALGPGNWPNASGAVVQAASCSRSVLPLPPDGEHFSYTGGKMRSSSRFFADYQRLHGINPFYTVVCRPPFWSAVALFDQRQDGWAGDRFGGGEPHYADLRSAQGAHWRSSSHLVLGPFHGTGSPFEGVNLGGEPRWPATPELAPSRGAIADGITISQDHTRVGGVWRPRPATLVFRSTHAPEDQPSDINRPASVIAPGTRQAEQLGLPTSFDVAWRLPRSGRCVIARGGELLELLAPATEARPARTSRIADFRDDQFSELAPPPWATRWACEPQGARPSGDVGEPVAVKGGVTQQGREGTAPRSAGGVA